MQKIFLPLLFVMAFVTKASTQQRLFDQPVQLKTCNITIDANPFIATTVVEMEFYNPKEQEVEARQTFSLNRGQVITGFELELNGKYREGSIEERWKARQAYSAVVGKRIDPALLQMNGQNYYSLNIYPVAAHSSRKVKFTIVQMMQAEEMKLSYSLPLNFNSATENFNLRINVSKPASIPNINKGLLSEQYFDMGNEMASLNWSATGIILNKPISFSIGQFSNQPQFCINKRGGITNFLMRYYPDAPRFSVTRAKTINVYWDVSLSGLERNLSRELEFLEKYIAVNEVKKVNIVLFNHQVQGTIVYNADKERFSYIRNFLLGYKYNGATELGNLNFSNVLADAVLLFSDGVNSIGNDLPKLGAVQVNFITSTYRHADQRYRNIVGNTGGFIINLNYTPMDAAAKRIDSAENFLLRYNAGNIFINESFPMPLGRNILLSGTISKPDNLELVYGNNASVLKAENYFLSPSDACGEDLYKKISMLKTYDSLMYGYHTYYNWRKIIEFGLTEKVVTPQTSYLVLERIEDYIRYKIAPPKELEQQCAEMNYVYRSEYKIKELNEFTEQEKLQTAISVYNNRINWWGKDQPPIDLNKPLPVQSSIDVVSAPGLPATSFAQGRETGNAVTVGYGYKSGGASELKEVVVTSAFGIRRTARSSSASVQNLSGEQLNTIRQIDVNNALAGKVAGVQVRSQSAAKLGAETVIRIRGENSLGVGNGALYVLDGTIMPNGTGINPDDIEDISVLQGPAAAALFGPDGANGAIVITTKKAKKGYPRQSYVWSEYKLSSMPDEDYVRIMRQASDYELWDVYVDLEKENRMNVGFYFEMADIFFGRDKKDKAHELMYNAIELCQGSSQGLRLAAFLYEKWGCFDKAIAVYKGLLKTGDNNLLLKRDLALAYFQDKQYAEAVRTYYSVVTASEEQYNTYRVKEHALAEMNAIIAMHRGDLDISYINPHLLRMLPVDLRITIESNGAYLSNPSITEPAGEICRYNNQYSRQGGRFMNSDYYWSNSNLVEYAVKNARTGQYRVKVDAYDNNHYAADPPTFVRVISFRNFQKENMTMEVKLFDLDNQYGVVELDAVRW
ncbi:MAG TPA: VIT domain-containing protein [Ferruginibacter sp.]|nr:VIT domain-containing protein [Ferruginibacter sp.]